MKTEDALRVVFAPSTKVCSNNSDHPFRRADRFEVGADLKSIIELHFALLAGARATNCRGRGRPCFRFRASIQFRHQIKIGLAMKTDE